MRAMKIDLPRKLRSRSGVSILFGLLFFMLAAMVSIVILGAAVTTSKRLADDAKRGRESLAVISAAKLFAQCLGETECVITTTTEYDADGVEISSSVSPDTGTSALKELLNHGMDQVINHKEDLTPIPGTERAGFRVDKTAITVRDAAHNPAQAFPEVEMRNFTLYPKNDEQPGDSYRVTALFSLPDPTPSDPAAQTHQTQKIFLTASAAIVGPDTIQDYDEPKYDDVDGTMTDPGQPEIQETKVTWTVELSTREGGAAS